MSFRGAFPVLAILALSGCDSGLGMYYREGVSVARQQQDTQQCESLALAQAPVVISREEVAEYRTVRVCDSDGSNCRDRQVLSGTQETTTDVNKSLRDRVRQQCLNDRGYRYVSIPTCPEDVRATTPPRATRVLPALTETSCTIDYKNGSYQIVSRG